MRSLPLLLALLIGATGLLLGIQVMLAGPAAPAQTTAAPAAQGSAARDPATLPQGHVYAGVSVEPSDVNPFTSHGTLERRFVLGMTHEGLLDTDPVTGALRGALAASWALAADGMSCTFTLRDGVRFSDGAPMTMADVLFGWELAKAGHLPLGFVGDAFDRVAAAEALDERRLRVTFKELYYAAVRAVGESWFVARRTFFVDRVAAAAARLGEPVPAVDSAAFATLLAQIDRECGPGTGPFMLPSDADGPTTWRRRQDLTLPRNPHNWRRLVEPGTWNLGGFRLLFREGSAVFNALLDGEVDWHSAPSVDEVLASRPELAADYVKLAYDYETLGVMGVIWNFEKEPLRDRDVRRALGMLMDRDGIVKGQPDRAVPALAFAKPGSPSYPTDLVPLPFDTKRARRLLREAGYDPENGTRLELVIVSPRDMGPMDLAVTLLQHAAKEAGVGLTVEQLSWSAFVARKTQRDWDGLVVNRSFRPWGDPYDFVHSQGMDNDGHWQNAEADRLAAAARRELDAGKRNALWRELHALVHAEQPFAFLVHPRSCVLFNRHIQGAEPGPRGLWPERWWVPEEHQRQ